MSIINQGDWDFIEKHVQPDSGVTEGRNFVSSESVIICAAPFGDNETVIAEWIPIGLTENITFQQNKQIQQLYEIGSKKTFIIPGRTYKRAAISRIMFNGPSILKAISIFNMSKTDGTIGTEVGAGKDYRGGLSGVAANDEPAISVNENSTFPLSFENDPNLFIDLASQFFNRPVNMGIVLKDSEDEYFGAFLMKKCYVQSHQMTITGQQTIIMENINLIIDDIDPMAT